ncbi:hypothetical protein OS493_000433 [Desmophyllum pertusum]|uniref:Uncharacterized protein n=1 Tax=Desmophyllum pertusum TaxID=174260 RepID=A0A9X0A7C1_9CNID|nr:hypothetical protein OS493_000433 [Desmophyllum pertusum]
MVCSAADAYHTGDSEEANKCIIHLLHSKSLLSGPSSIRNHQQFQLHQMIFSYYKNGRGSTVVAFDNVLCAILANTMLVLCHRLQMQLIKNDADFQWTLVSNVIQPGQSNANGRHSYGTLRPVT